MMVGGNTDAARHAVDRVAKPVTATSATRSRMQPRNRGSPLAACGRCSRSNKLFAAARHRLRPITSELAQIRVEWARDGHKARVSRLVAPTVIVISVK